MQIADSLVRHLQVVGLERKARQVADPFMEEMLRQEREAEREGHDHQAAEGHGNNGNGNENGSDQDA
jgi:hypothetical protein